MLILARRRSGSAELFDRWPQKASPADRCPGILDYVSLLTGYVSYLSAADARRVGANATANRPLDRSWRTDVIDGVEIPRSVSIVSCPIDDPDSR